MAAANQGPASPHLRAVRISQIHLLTPLMNMNVARSLLPHFKRLALPVDDGAITEYGVDCMDDSC